MPKPSKYRSLKTRYLHKNISISDMKYTYSDNTIDKSNVHGFVSFVALLHEQGHSKYYHRGRTYNWPNDVVTSEDLFCELQAWNYAISKLDIRVRSWVLRIARHYLQSYCNKVDSIIRLDPIELI